jgi:protein-S-isoprenylcysteine O-methyltransferase Ste14
MTQENKLDKPLPLWFMLILPLYTGGFLAIFLFPFAGDWRWLEGWIFVISFTIILWIGYLHINKANPRVLRNRMKTRKEGLTAATQKSASSDRWLMPVMSIAFFATMILPAWAHRQDWLTLPFWVELVGLVISCGGNIIVMIAMLQNAHASKILDINQDQKLIDTGMYGKVRHPLYSGFVLIMLGLPIALGYLPGLIPGSIAACCLVLRIKFEEEMLVNGMDGYEEYQQRVKYKLFPGIY